MEKTLDQKLSQVTEMQKLFDKVKPEVEQLLSLLVSYKETNAKINCLKDFYQTEWMLLYETLPVAERDRYEIMGQDPLWNLITDHYRYTHQFLREIALQITEE